MTVLRNTLVQHVDDLDQLRDIVREADTEFIQLGPGRLRAQLVRVTLDGICYDYHQIDELGVCGRGGASTQWLSFVAPETPNTINRRLVQPGQLALFRPGCSYEGVHPHFSRNHLLTVRPDDLAAFAEKNGYHVDIDQLIASEVLHGDSGACRRIQELGRRLVNSIHSNPSLFETPEDILALRDDFLDALCSAIATKPANPPESREWSHAQYCQWVRQTDAYLAEHAGQPVTITGLCAALNVAPRTLNHAFRQVLGVSPGKYVQLQRLAAVRRKLQQALPDASITAIAIEHGFTHLGRFSSLYQRFFGELPSQTLRRPQRSLKDNPAK